MKARFTLIELLVVIAIIAILAALLLPSLSAAREKGRSISCMNNQKNIMLARTLYTDDSDGFYPWGITDDTWDEKWPAPSGSTSTPELLLDHIGRAFDSFVCPSDPKTIGYNWWQFTGRPSFDSTRRISYMFSEDAMYGTAIKGKGALSQVAILAPDTFGYMSEGWMQPNGWSWSKVDPTDPLHRLNWDHRFSVNFTFGDGHCELRSRYGAREIRDNPLHLDPRK